MRKVGKKIYPICPDCKRVKDKSVEVKSIYTTKSIGCICSDNISYPNKFSYAFLDQLPVLNWQPEYNPDWLKPYRYDNYFEYQGQKYIFEMDGGFHDVNVNDMINNSKNKKKIKIKQADKIKDDLAKKHGIKVIRIDCNESNMNYIKNNIIDSVLSNIFELNNIDWNRCDEFAHKNIVKEVSLFWEDNNCPSYKIIKNIFHIKKLTIKKYLTIGAQYGWCSYYNGVYTEKRKRNIRVYDCRHQYIDTFSCIGDLVVKSDELFKVHFTKSMVIKACNKEIEQYKGYIFEWAND